MRLLRIHSPAAAAPSPASSPASSPAGGAPTTAEIGALDTILLALQKAGIPLRHDCGGKARCGTCRVAVLSPPLTGLSPMGGRERARLEALGLPADGSVRLACQTRTLRDIDIEPLVPV